MFKSLCLTQHCNPLQQTLALLEYSPYTPWQDSWCPHCLFKPLQKRKPLLGVCSPTIPYTLSPLKWPYVKHTNKQQIKTRATINFQNNTNLHPKLDTKKTILTTSAWNTKQLFFESRFLFVGIWVHGVLISSV
jgi:hypothetical protein